MRALLGTQAECVHSPPSFAFSISATRAPTRAAADATFRPPDPPPNTTRSYITRSLPLVAVGHSFRAERKNAIVRARPAWLARLDPIMSLVSPFLSTDYRPPPAGNVPG